jgi:cytochrome c5
LEENILNLKEIEMKLAIISAAALAALFGMGQVAAADGKAVFEKACAGCHKAMSPKLTGDKAKWDEILKKGNPAIIESVLKGKGPMKALGGAANAEDAKAATEYMLTQIK